MKKTYGSNLINSKGDKVKVFITDTAVLTNLFTPDYKKVTDPDTIKNLEIAGELTGAKRDKFLENLPNAQIQSAPTAPSKEEKPSVKDVYTILNERTAEQSKPAPKKPEKKDTPLPPPIKKTPSKSLVETAQKFINFFSEFSFTISARFLNTLAHCESVGNAIAYTQAYVDLCNISDGKAIKEKSSSAEFRLIAQDLINEKIDRKVNNRLVVYYGDAGTGKTTKAMTEYPSAPVVPCNSSILPDELMRTFDFNDANGNPVFKPSSLRLAMENGTPIIFDEINLLNFDCLRMLQTLLDGKEHINYNGEDITIRDGFKVIGTMNLVVNDQIYSLPTPLVDRAETIKEFKLSANDLAAYMM